MGARAALPVIARGIARRTAARTYPVTQAAQHGCPACAASSCTASTKTSARCA